MTDFLHLPVIRLEVERMKQTMMIALSQYTAQLDEQLQQAVERFCTPENLHEIITTETNAILEQVIRDEVDQWFMYGEGRKYIRQAVEKKLERDFS